MSAQMIARLCVSGTHLLVSLHKGSEVGAYDKCIHHTSLYYVHASNNVVNVAIGKSHLKTKWPVSFSPTLPYPNSLKGGLVRHTT